MRLIAGTCHLYEVAYGGRVTLPCTHWAGAASVVSVVLMLVALAACSRPEVTPAEIPDEMAHNFGTVEMSEKLENTFTIENPTANDVEITRIQTDCGCVAAAVDSKQIPSGGKTAIRVSFAPKGAPGPKRGTAMVHTNDPIHPTITLYLICDFAPKVFLTAGVVNLGTVTDYDVGTAEGELRVKAVSEGMFFKVTKVDLSKAPGLSAEILTAAPSNECIVRVSNAAPLQAGRYSGEISVLTDAPGADVLSCRVKARVKGKIGVQPEFVSLDPANSNRSPSRSCFRVLPGYVRDFKILGVDTPDGVTSTIESKGEYYVVALDDIPADCSSDGRKITLHTDVPGAESVSIPIKVLGCNEDT